MNASQKLEPRDRRTSICRWKKWRRSSAGEGSSSRRPCSHRLCRLPRLLRLRSKRQKGNRAAVTTARPACRVRKEGRRAAVSLDHLHRQSRNRNRAGECLSLQIKLYLFRRLHRLQAMYSSGRTAHRCRCQCTHRCRTIHPLVQSSPAHKVHETAPARLQNTIAAVQRHQSRSTPSTLHASTHRPVACDLVHLVPTAHSKTKLTGTPTPPHHHSNQQAAPAQIQPPSIVCQTTTLARPCLQRKDVAA
jgi:hypothetical protein